MISTISIQALNHKLEGEIKLPLSKSFRNRQLMLQAYSGMELSEPGGQEADDSRLLYSLLRRIEISSFDDPSQPLELNCKNAGTVFRFLLPYLCSLDGYFILTGAARMLERPIGPLVDTLSNMGADLQYLGNEAYPPLAIAPAQWQIHDIYIDSSLSSQFASALVMLLPRLQAQSQITLQGNIASRPYLVLSLQMMHGFGIEYQFDDPYIEISGKYQATKDLSTVELDWSSAAFWYELLAIGRSGKIFLPGLYENDLQGDKALVTHFENLGVHTVFEENGISIEGGGEIQLSVNIDFKEIPDLAPALIVSCAALEVMGRFTGLASLNLKESQRMEVLSTELEKLGYDLRCIEEDEYVLINDCVIPVQNQKRKGGLLHSHNDHRMVMAFAPLALIFEPIEIDYPEAIEKSYPQFWFDFQQFFKVQS